MSVNFQDESEVKEYLENIGIEYRFGCFSEKKPEVCLLLGEYFESVKRDWVNARKLFRMSCNEYKHGKSCFKYGNYALIGKGAKVSNPLEALKAFEIGCSSNDEDTCFSAGLLYCGERPLRNMPMEIETNMAKGFEYITKACSLNNGNACDYLSKTYAFGIQAEQPKKDEVKINENDKVTDSSPKSSTEKPKEPFTVQKNMKKAFEFAYKACELKTITACANLSYMYSHGEGTEKNEELAEKYKKIVQNYLDEHKNNKSQLVFQQTK